MEIQVSENKLLREIKKIVKNLPFSDWNYKASSNYDMRGKVTQTYKFSYNQENLNIISEKESLETCVSREVINNKYSVYVYFKEEEKYYHFENKGKRIYKFLNKQRNVVEKEKNQKRMQNIKKK